MEPQELHAVLDEVQAGHSDAFYKIIRAYGLPIRSYLCGQLYHVDEADDLAQEIFIAAYQNLNQFRRDLDFNRWLFGIAHNKLQDHFRSKGRQKKALGNFQEKVQGLLEDNLRDSAAAQTSDRIEALLLCIGRLPEKLRKVVRRNMDGDKPQDLAMDLSISLHAVYNLQYRAMQLLRTCLEKESA